MLWWILACSQPAPPAVSEGPVPNLLLITVCSWRADHLGAYGGAAHTPNIDAFATDSVVFDHAYANATFTDASHASLFTGLYPGHEGLLDFGAVIHPEAHTLPEILTLYNYRVRAFVDSTRSMHPIGLRNMTRGFGPVDEVNAEDLPAHLSEWAAKDLQPWMAWVHLRRTHIPYGAGEEYMNSLHPAVRTWLEAQAQAAKNHFKPGAGPDPVKTFVEALHADPAVKKSLEAAYDSAVAGADAQVGEVLKAIAVERKHTVVVIAGDHGETLGEEDLLGHQGILAEGVLHVPLLVSVPGLAPRRVEDFVSLVDVLPTLLEKAKAVVPAGLDGESLAPLLEGATREPHPILAQAIQLVEPNRTLHLSNVLIDFPYWYSSDGSALRHWENGVWTPVTDSARATKMDLQIIGMIEGSRWSGARPSLPDAVRKELQERGYW